MSQGELNSSWLSWVQQNLGRGCDVIELASILGQHGFRGAPVGAALGQIGATAAAEQIDHGRLSQALSANGQIFQAVEQLAIAVGGSAAQAKINQYVVPAMAAAQVLGSVVPAPVPVSPQQYPTDKLQIYTIPHFLSDAECDQLVHLVNQRLRPSTLSIPTADPTFRNSKTCDLCLMDDPLIGVVDNRIAKTLGIQLSYAEGIQAQRYDVGEQFKQHTDFFEPGTPEYQQYAGERGNRTWTFMIYLNAVEKGGGTQFFAIDHIFMPEKGLAVAWNNLYLDGRVNTNTTHAGLPVESGFKVIINKWFREKGSGPMFL